MINTVVALYCPGEGDHHDALRALLSAILGPLEVVGCLGS